MSFTVGNIMIAENIKLIREKIASSCEQSKRTNNITLVAVSKTKPIESLMEAYNCGQRIFGENKVQELCQKYETMPKDIQWHMIGHLQRNKVKYIVPFISMIHSVDSVRLAEEISKEASKMQRKIPILIEVNMAKEESKFGFFEKEVEEAIEIISKLPYIQINGLMTIAPYTPNPEENRTYFEKMYQLYVDINNKNIDNVHMKVLSMGMTNDYEVAISEGSTMVRVGTGIFGDRTTL